MDHWYCRRSTNYIPCPYRARQATGGIYQLLLQDEYTVTVDPLLANAIGDQTDCCGFLRAERAWQILHQAAGTDTTG